MKIEKTKNSLVITSKYFNAEQILKCGQVFRFKPFKDGYILNAGKELAILVQKGDTSFIRCTDEDYFYRYFDLDTDYSKIIKQLNCFPILKQATDFGQGIRILKQEKLETVISFIISANNNIKRIQGIIDRICLSLGEKHQFEDITYYSFPEVNKLSFMGTDFYKAIGAGYRARYIADSSKMIESGFDLEMINELNTEFAGKKLMELKGVGKKVCDCILLFSYGRQDVFPVDTWMEKVYRDYINTNCKDGMCRKKIADDCVNIFKNLSGYSQQYLFYYKRELTRSQK